jgi:hypothetical protein
VSSDDPPQYLSGFGAASKAWRKAVAVRSGMGWALSNLFALLLWNRLTCRELSKWTNFPLEMSPKQPPDYS